MAHSDESSASLICPTSDEWREALRGHVPEPRWSEIEIHLLACARCEETVDALTELSDTFIRELCQRPSTADDEPEFRELYSGLVAASGFAFKDVRNDVAALPFQLGNYELLEPLGYGASSSVYKARHMPLDRLVAVKLLRPDRDFDTDRVDRFIQEVRAIGGLDHPHLVRATDAGETDGRHFLTMEYVPGVDLSTVARTCFPLRVADACEMVRQAALGLAYLHQNGFVHRDVKPSNMLLTENGEIKLLDLGLVQFAGSSEVVNAGENCVTPTPADRAMDRGLWPSGTPDYMPPEQWQAIDAIDFRSDLYSLGCTLCKLLTDNPPFRPLPEKFADRFEAHCRAPIPALANNRPAEATASDPMPADLQTIFERLLAKRKEDRFKDASSVAAALAPFSVGSDLRVVAHHAGLQPSASPALPKLPGHQRFVLSRRRALLWGALAVAGSAYGLSRLGRGWKRGVVSSIQTDRWRTLTPASPAVLVAEAGTNDVMWATVPPDGLSVTSPSRALLNLGQPLLGCFQLAVDLSQTKWTGGVGLFFRFNRLPDDGGDAFTFQSVELDRRLPETDQPLRLLWQGFRVTQKVRGWETHCESWASTIVKAPDHVVAALEIALGVDGFPQVTWCGRSVPADQWVISLEGRQRARVSDQQLSSHFLGRVGLVADGRTTESAEAGTCVFYRPRLAYLTVDNST